MEASSSVSPSLFSPTVALMKFKLQASLKSRRRHARDPDSIVSECNKSLALQSHIGLEARLGFPQICLQQTIYTEGLYTLPPISLYTLHIQVTTSTSYF